MEQVISMQDISLAFRGRPALQRLSFAVNKGEIFGFLGPSGAGKTTTIKLLTRQLRPDSGKLSILGREVGTLHTDAFARIGILTDNSGLYERLSVYENLRLFADLRGLPGSAVDNVLERVGLAQERKKPGKALSRGMKQRLMLARAVLHQPELLFLDEPTAALDPATTREIHRLLTELNRQGTTIFLTTHNMEEADRLCSRVAFLDHGTIVECGPPDQLKLKYAKDELIALTDGGETLCVPKTAEGLRQLAGQLEGKNLLTLHSTEPNLEEIFLQLTGRGLL